MVRKRTSAAAICRGESSSLQIAGATLTGKLLTEEKLRPIVAAQVTIVELDRTAPASDKGADRFVDTAPGTAMVWVRQIGFARYEARLEFRSAGTTERGVVVRPERRMGLVMGGYARVRLHNLLLHSGSRAELVNLSKYLVSSREAIEYYDGAAQMPSKYARPDTNCGVLVTRTRGSP